MTLDQVIAHFQELTRRSLFGDDGYHLAHHFSLYFTPPDEQLESLLALHGIQPAYDGLRLRI